MNWLGKMNQLKSPKQFFFHRFVQDLHWEFFFRIINDFVHRFILDRAFVDFTVSLLILPFDIDDFNTKMVKSTVNP
jgi:hypothetical protein